MFKQLPKREVITRGVWFIGLSVESKQYAGIRCSYCNRGLRAHLNPGTKVVCPNTDRPVAEYIVPDDIATKPVKLSRGVYKAISRQQFSFSEAKFVERQQTS